MKPSTKYIFAVVGGFISGAVIACLVTMNLLGKFIESNFASIEGSEAIQIIQALNRIQEGKLEGAITILEYNLNSHLIIVASSPESSRDKDSSEIKAANMALEYWSKHPSAAGQDMVKSQVEEFINAK